MILMLRLTKLKKLVVVLSASILMFALPVSAFADSVALTLAGIQGESIKNGPGAIDVLAFSFGASNATGTGNTVGKPQYTEINITKNIDKSSLPLLLDLATGKRIASGTLFVRHDVGKQQFDYFKVKLKNIVITSYSISSGGDRPTENISLQVQQMEFDYTQMKPDGTAGATDTIFIDEAANTAK
jgi:type VI secretion system secreted protein Hcp